MYIIDIIICVKFYGARKIVEPITAEPLGARTGLLSSSAPGPALGEPRRPHWLPHEVIVYSKKD